MPHARPKGEALFENRQSLLLVVVSRRFSVTEPARLYALHQDLVKVVFLPVGPDTGRRNLAAIVFIGGTLADDAAWWPKGKATRVIVTTWDIPRKDAAAHDAEIRS